MEEVAEFPLTVQSIKAAVPLFKMPAPFVVVVLPPVNVNLNRLTLAPLSMVRMRKGEGLAAARAMVTPAAGPVIVSMPVLSERSGSAALRMIV